MEFPKSMRTPFDVEHNPPEVYLWVQFILFLAMGGLWAIAYILYLRKAFHDKSYGMPVLALCANVSWEFLYIVSPPTILDRVGFTIPFIIDVCIVYATFKFWPGEWKSNPLMAQNRVAIITSSLIMTLLGLWAFKIQFQGLTDVAFWSGYALQVFLGTMSTLQLLTRGSTRGHSWAIWWFRALGTLAPNFMSEIRVWHYPGDWPNGYSYVHSPLGIFVMWTSTFLDFVVYPVVFKYVEKLERRQKQIKNY